MNFFCRKLPLPAMALFCVLLLLLTLPSAVVAHDPSQVIRFGIFPYKSPRAIVELFGPIARRMEEKTGKKVELVSAPDYNSYVERARAGLYDVAVPCVTCFFKVESAGYHVIARGEPFFHGAIIARQDSGIIAMEQLRGRRIAAIGRHSYAGYIFARTMLEEEGLDPGTDVTFSFLNKVDSVILAVLNRQYDAGVIRLDVLEDKQFASVREELAIVDLSPPVPQFPIIVKDSMDSVTVAQILEVLLAISPDDPVDRKLLENMRFERFAVCQGDAYEDFRKISEQIGDLAH